MRLSFVLALLAVPALAQPAPKATSGGLRGLGAPGALGKDAVRTTAFEAEVLAAVNKTRVHASLEPLQADDRLRALARREAELAARGSSDAAAASARVREQELAPHGFRWQYAFGTTGARLVGDLVRDAQARTAVLGEFDRLGVGAFWVPAEPPYFQVALLFVHDLDPMAGRPGLSPAQTDPVINAASERIRTCYDTALRVNPNLQGDVLFEISIGPNGGVDAARLLRSLDDADFDACALVVIHSLRFPPPYKGKPVTLRQPLRLLPPQGEKRVGRLTPVQVAGAFLQAQADLRACYDRRLRERPQLAGTITLGLTVAPDGSVSTVEVAEDELGDPELATCIVGRARSLRFPRPEFEAGAAVTYPLRFAPR